VILTPSRTPLDLESAENFVSVLVDAIPWYPWQPQHFIISHADKVTQTTKQMHEIPVHLKVGIVAQKIF
jgi:hypothetical protein